MLVFCFVFPCIYIAAITCSIIVVSKDKIAPYGMFALSLNLIPAVICNIILVSKDKAVTGWIFVGYLYWMGKLRACIAGLALQEKLSKAANSLKVKEQSQIMIPLRKSTETKCISETPMFLVESTWVIRSRSQEGQRWCWW